MNRPRPNSQSSAPEGFRPAPRQPTPWQPRFGIRELLMLMLICSVLAAALGYLYQDEKAGGKSMRFIFLTVAGPTLMAMLLGMIFIGYELLKNRGRKKKKSQPSDEF
jgi:hypothetical protein